jgi:hypothetical protein
LIRRGHDLWGCPKLDLEVIVASDLREFVGWYLNSMAAYLGKIIEVYIRMEERMNTLVAETLMHGIAVTVRKED